jgi:hypothetical protein
VNLRLTLTAALALLLAAGRAGAAPFDGSAPVDAYKPMGAVSSRVLGLGGAYVGVAEGLEGVASNPAAVAHRERNLRRMWSLDATLAWRAPTLSELASQDLDNDGVPDRGLTSRSSLQLGAGGQYGRLGVGIVVTSWGLTGPRGAAVEELTATDGSVAVGWSGPRDELVVGVSLTGGNGEVVSRTGGVEAGRVSYGGLRFRAGGLWRPRGERWRLGASLDPGARALPDGSRAELPFPTPTAFLFPWVAAVGGAIWIGPNARRVNDPPPIALERHPEWEEPTEWESSTSRPVLLSLQAEVVGPSPGAVSFSSAVVDGAEAVPSGRKASVLVRAGAEWEPWVGWLHVRGGSYLEPSRTGSGPRLHGTFGAEVRIPCWPWDLSLGVAGDVASRFQQIGLSAGFWSDVGPGRAPARTLGTTEG